MLKRNMRFGLCVIEEGQKDLGQLRSDQCTTVLCNCTPIKWDKCLNCLLIPTCSGNITQVTVCAKDWAYAHPLTLG